MTVRNPLSVSLPMLALLAAAPVAAQLCPGAVAPPQAPGQMFRHLPYAETPPAALVAAPYGLAPDGTCRVHPAMLADLMRLAAEADRDPALAGQLRLISCWRGTAYQAQVFCRDLSLGMAQRAWASAPPGHSEHATGYVVDFGAANLPNCNLDACFAASPAGRWLLRNAARFGFELSFPTGSRQRVKWEPWHWRWVGTGPGVPGAAAARATFALARGLYPAEPRPADAPLALRLASQPDDPTATPAPAAEEPRPRGKRQRRRSRR